MDTKTPNSLLSPIVLTLSFCIGAGHALAEPASTGDKPIDEREPPFGEFDYSWLNGSNRQPASLLVLGPVTGSVYIDSFYAYQFSKPSDHTIFPTTTAPRHDEFSTNLAAIGVDVTGLDGPIGRVYLQAGANTEADVGQDPTTKRGSYLSATAFNPIQQAAAGWHFHALHGINVEFGILPSYVGVESYLPQENWNYTHSFASDFTPYYFSGSRTQIYLTQRQKLEVWLVNGWQTLGQWHEGKAAAYLYNWRPNGDLSLTHSLYFGREAKGDAHSLREYTDNVVQWKYFSAAKGARINSAAVSVVADYGYEHRSNSSSGIIGGGAIAHRTQFMDIYAMSLRADFYKDATQAVILQLPQSQTQTALPETTKSFVGHGYTVTFDLTPSPWIIFRLEYAHRATNIPYFAKGSGITPPSDGSYSMQHPFTPDLATSDDRVIANVTLRL